MAEQVRAFVCGHPIAHSRSPLIHGHWLRQHHIRGTYEPVDIAPADFANFIETFPKRGFFGGNITIPHKEDAFRLVADLDDAARAIGAVNTVWIEGGRLRGGNTDWLGFSANLDDYAPSWRGGKRAVVLGAGGAARGVVYALLAAGYQEVEIANRTKARADDLARSFGSHVTARDWLDAPEGFAGADILVNTTSVGMEGSEGALPPLDRLPDSAIVTDIVYVPLETPLLAAARARGLTVVDGLGMLLHQAAPGFERWFGIRPAVDPHLRALVLADIGAHP